MVRLPKAAFAAAISCVLLAGCSASQMAKPPTSFESTPMQQRLLALPPPAQQIAVALYDYRDLTGQYKPSETVTSYSRAVTQGASAVLIKALQEAGQGSWFKVLERAGLDSLLKERAIIRETRQQYLGQDGRQLPPPPPLLYAGLILEGGIIGFDSNTLTGGAGARLLGIGGSTEYREDTVTVYLRGISTQTGEVLRSVMAKKTIFSYGVSADVFKFIGYRELLEVEAGFTSNEPGLVALRQAIEQAVYALIVEGAAANLWTFRDQEAGRSLLDQYYTAQAATIRIDQDGNPVRVAGAADTVPRPRPKAPGSADTATPPQVSAIPNPAGRPGDDPYAQQPSATDRAAEEPAARPLASAGRSAASLARQESASTEENAILAATTAEAPTAPDELKTVAGELTASLQAFDRAAAPRPARVATVSAASLNRATLARFE